MSVGSAFREGLIYFVMDTQGLHGDGRHRTLRHEFLGLPIDCLTRAETVAELARRLDRREVTQHVALNASKVLLCHDDPRLQRIVANCGVINADGMSVVWAGRVMRVPVPERVTGIDLLEDLWALAAERHLRVFLLGATQPVLERTVELAQARNVHVSGALNGYWTSDEAVVDRVRASNSDILFLAIPSPRKEIFLAQWLEKMGVTLAVGVGGSFDVLSGEVRRAPRWMQDTGLEWLARLIQEPRRLARRYLVGNLRFAGLVIRSYRQRSA